jgi:hypothetical protein
MGKTIGNIEIGKLMPVILAQPLNSGKPDETFPILEDAVNGIRDQPILDGIILKYQLLRTGSTRNQHQHLEKYDHVPFHTFKLPTICKI